MFLYYYESPTGWYGWLSGPEVGLGRGGLLVQARAVCVEDADRRHTWQFYDGDEFVDDDTLAVECFVPGTGAGEGGEDNGVYDGKRCQQNIKRKAHLP